MVEENGQYTNELLLNVEEEIQEVMNSMLLVNLSTEEKREVANKIAVIRFAGAATGMLIGAFLGIGVAVASVVILFRAAKLTKVFKAISIGVTAAVDAGVAVETGAGSGIAVGVILGTAALAGAIGGGITGYKAAKEADSVLDAIKIAAEVNLENAKDVVKKAEELPSNVYKKFQ
ncbi:GTPase IMAP family member 7-like protein [Labeo rohita]|uniref:GTPase IMAP family member 7-like protein n=2 Tax=Labeo rohita TaxID=84645 RepID=A0A498N989_LABRO|nr:GTPase IMAP family member 7-like protein [Labeo rohita]